MQGSFSSRYTLPPIRNNPALARLASLFANPAFWAGALAAHEDNEHHDAAIARLRALREQAEFCRDVMAHPEFARWLAY